MKTVLLALGILFTSTCLLRADGLGTFRASLQDYQANGPEAFLRTWFDNNDQEKIGDLRDRLVGITRNLGNVVDSEVFAPHDIGRHVQRLYGVIYFQKSPLWLRADFYTIEGRGGFLSLEFSRNATDILPIDASGATSAK